MMPDTIRTVAQLQAVLDRAYQSGYADAVVALQARIDSLCTPPAASPMSAIAQGSWLFLAGAFTGILILSIIQYRRER